MSVRCIFAMLVIASAAAVAVVLATGSGASTFAQLERLGLVSFEQRFEDFEARPIGASSWGCTLVEASTPGRLFERPKTVWRCPANVATAITMSAREKYAWLINSLPAVTTAAYNTRQGIITRVSEMASGAWKSIESAEIGTKLKGTGSYVRESASGAWAVMRKTLADSKVWPQMHDAARQAAKRLGGWWTMVSESGALPAGSAAAALAVLVGIFAFTWRPSCAYRGLHIASQELDANKASDEELFEAVFESSPKVAPFAASPLQPSPNCRQLRRSASPSPKSRLAGASMDQNSNEIQQPAVQSARRRSDTPPPPVSPQQGPSSESAEAALLVIVNTGTLEEVRSLKGFGPKRATAILNHRMQHGPFASTDDIQNAGVSVAVIKKCLSS